MPLLLLCSFFPGVLLNSLYSTFHFLLFSGFEPAKKPAVAMTPTSPTSATSITHPTNVSSPGKTNAQRALEKEEKRRRKAERKEEKRALKEERKRHMQVTRTRKHAIENRARGRERSIMPQSPSWSQSRPRSWSRTPPARRRSASPRRRPWSPRHRSRSRSLSQPRTPPHRPEGYRDTFYDTYEPARRRCLDLGRSPSLGSGRSKTSPPPHNFEPIQESEHSHPDREEHDRGRENRLRKDSGARRDLGGGLPSVRQYDRYRYR
jgi:hypothetical protein